MRTIENYEYDLSTPEKRDRFYSTGHLLRLLGFLGVLNFEELAGQEFTDTEGWLIVRYKENE